MNLRGVSNSTYSYAHYNEKILNNKSVIFFNDGNNRNLKEVINKFKKRFKVIKIPSWKTLLSLFLIFVAISKFAAVCPAASMSGEDTSKVVPFKVTLTFGKIFATLSTLSPKKFLIYFELKLKKYRVRFLTCLAGASLASQIYYWLSGVRRN